MRADRLQGLLQTGAKVSAQALLAILAPSFPDDPVPIIVRSRVNKVKEK